MDMSDLMGDHGERFFIGKPFEQARVKHESVNGEISGCVWNMKTNRGTRSSRSSGSRAACTLHRVAFGSAGKEAKEW